MDNDNQKMEVTPIMTNDNANNIFIIVSVLRHKDSSQIGPFQMELVFMDI